MKKNNFELDTDVIQILYKICENNNMDETQVINKLITLWNEGGDFFYDSGYTYNFENKESVEDENDDCYFKAELIKDEYILK